MNNEEKGKHRKNGRDRKRKIKERGKNVNDSVSGKNTKKRRKEKKEISE